MMRGNHHMPYRINQKEIESVLKLGAPERYDHFIKRVADWQEVWTLKSPDGFVSMGDDQGREGAPFWPHPEYATLFATESWTDCAPASISAEDFVQRWLPGMDKYGRKVIAFPTPQLKGSILEPAKVRNDLMNALSQYE